MAEFVPNAADDLTKADASPTKAFFVDIITKDIQLDDAIQDLVDNCIDGAKRLRPGQDEDFKKLWIKIKISKDLFRISDNCGGIPLEIARKYAFKFGRAEGFKPTKGSVGQFGIGMKRALFKMGEQFSVNSVEPRWSYNIKVNVDTWASDDVHWDFDISDLKKGPHSVADTGTILEIAPLQRAVRDTFGQEAFIAELRRDIRVRHQHPMRLGLQISVNGEAIIPADLQLKLGEVVKPASRRYQDKIGSAILLTRLYAGVHESSRANAGWYVFCNGRCILEADQEKTTGWSDVSDSGVAVPKYHGQFARFRGYLFLDCEDASILPWNTTKTGLDLESDAYRRLRGRLIEATRPVIDFLNILDAETELADDDKILTKALGRTPSLPLERLPLRDVFTYQTPPAKGPPMATIKYRKLKSEVEELQDAFDISTLKGVGEKSFEFSYLNLVEDA